MINGDKNTTSRSVFDEAEWLCFGDETEAVIAKKDFEISEIADTVLTVTGLGFCEIYLNGTNVADRLCAPAWTNYVKTDTASYNYPIYDTMTYRILYEEIDLTPYLKTGKNSLVFHIGGGWFCQHESKNEGVKPYGKLMLCFNVRKSGISVAKSDGGVLWKKSFITRQNIYFGEKQDMRIGGYDFSDYSYSGFVNCAQPTAAPEAELNRQDCPPDRIIRTLKPELIFRRGDYAVYDLGECVTGFPVIEFGKTETDEVISLRFADELTEDGGLDFGSSGGNNRIQREEYIYDGKAKSAHQHFTWHACRYFDVIGNVEINEFRVVHTDLKQKAVFKSNEPVLQWLFDSFIRTQLNNSHCSIPSDCPHRERLGYTGDGQLTSDAVMDCFEAEGFYRKWIRDIADSQDIYNGHVQHTAPFYGGGGGPGGWGGAIVFVPYNFYKHYGDTELIKEYYPNMLAYLDYMDKHRENGLVVREEKDGWCLGDWCSPKNRNLIPPEFVNTYFFIKALDRVIELSDILGKDSAALKAKREDAVSAFLENYYDGETGTFCNSTEASDAYALDIGLGDSRTLDALVKKYAALGEFDSGIFGTYLLIGVLCESNHTELAKALLTSKKENTFYNMMKHGATTLWENWEGVHSHDHPMFGAVVKYLLKYFNEA
ncbi:MAG: family 78 glycoside hydrolase catalytic domain [Eubacterium sp.]|nr:family 78 glycoside hydrolase catalytic domain [Eubacterium sp.]